MNIYSFSAREVGISVLAINRKERDRKLRRMDILSAAEHVFGRKGYYKATMQDIARQAQYATGTVYLYFKDKETLYFSLVEEKMRDLLALIKERTAAVRDAQEKLKIYLEEKLDFFEKNQDFFRIFILENGAAQASIDSRIATSALAKEYLACISEIMRLAQKQKLVRADMDPSQGAGIFRSISNAVIMDWLKKNMQQTLSLRQMSRFILDIFLGGARPSDETK